MTSSSSGIAVIIPAAGSGSRLGADIPKAFVPVGGVPMFVRSAWAFRNYTAVIVAAPAGYIAQAQAALARHGVTNATVVVGAESRSGSIAAALAELPPDVSQVLIHDAARPAVSAELIGRVIAALESADAVVPAVPVTDSLKQVAADTVVAHVDRREFARAQTPQGFQRDVLERVYAKAIEDGTLANATDDVSLAAAAGFAVHTVLGEDSNVKVTTPADLRALEQTFNARTIRTGIGTDAHAFSDDGELALAGLRWPDVAALAGHSDGDVVVHALCDAFLSAAGLGDLGAQFGVAEPEWAGASSVDLLRRSLDLLASHGWRPVSAQAQLIGNRPKFAPRRDEAQALISQVVGVPVFLSATTTDGLGFLGRDEGIAAVATVMIESTGLEQVTA